MSGTTTPQGDQGNETARLCHDLRQYVAAGLMLAEVRGATALGEETERRLALISRVFKDINALLEEQYEGRLRIMTVDLGEVVRECAELTGLVSKVRIDVVAEHPVRVCADPALLRRAVLNVLNNATRAAGVGGRVSVRTGTHGTHAWIEVADDGAGFGRIPSVNGYGMSVVEAAVRAAQGRLEIYSGPGPGTRVRLRFPRTRTAGGVS